MTAHDRDRDASGRAHNARPRDGLGRPLARDSVAAFKPVPDELHLSVDDTITLAQTYLDNARPFHAHEVFELLWKSRGANERDLWQGLAQIAVGLTHALRGNLTGAPTLLRRGSDRLSSYDGTTYGIDVAGVITWAATVAADPAATPPPLALRR